MSVYSLDQFTLDHANVPVCWIDWSTFFFYFFELHVSLIVVDSITFVKCLHTYMYQRTRTHSDFMGNAIRNGDVPCTTNRNHPMAVVIIVRHKCQRDLKTTKKRNAERNNNQKTNPHKGCVSFCNRDKHASIIIIISYWCRSKCKLDKGIT